MVSLIFCLLMEGSGFRTNKLLLRIQEAGKKHTVLYGSGSGTLPETCVSADLLNRIVLPV
jgi:hypothetical protein